ncbi:MAG: hypothetical protein PVJ84_12980 [Desulfobacteraceae bacterium]
MPTNQLKRLTGDSNRAASQTFTCSAVGLGCEIIFIAMHHHAAADDYGSIIPFFRIDSNPKSCHGAQ